jgi:fructuronate reductase
MPQTAPGFIVRGLQARRAAGLQPFTVISCDNLPKNGSLIRAVTIDLARYIDPDLADWINTNGAFPSSMVDRIVPATTPEDIARIETLSNQKDAAPVLHEPFSQWVITDDFIGNRPEFEKVGVQIVEDINPYETMKLRMLNGAHSALAYLGLLTGYQTVADAIADETIVRFLNKLWKKEIIPTLLAPTHLNLENYAVDLQTRFSNTMIQHQLSQIAMDGSQKLPQRILETIKDRLEHNGQIDCLLLVIAGWIAYTKDVSDKDDPFAAILRNCHTNDPEKTVSNILALHCIFDTNLTARIEATLCEYTAIYASKTPIN